MCDDEQILVVKSQLMFGLLQAMYAAAVLSTATMSFAKLSSAFLIDRVAPQSPKARRVLFGMVAMWAAFSTIAILFQCGVPNWNPRSVQCHRGSVLIAVTVANIVTDLVIAVWLIPTLWTLRLDREKCITAGMLFGSRAV